jgi:hypothetical protein
VPPFMNIFRKNEMWKKKLPPPDNLAYNLTPRVVPQISDYFQILAAADRLNSLTDGDMFFYYQPADILRILKECDIKFDDNPQYVDRKPTYISEKWIQYCILNQNFAELTLLQQEVLSRQYFGFSEIQLRNSRLSGKEATENQVNSLGIIVMDSLLTDSERERLQAVMDEGAITKSRASRLIGYFWGSKDRDGSWRTRGVIYERTRSNNNPCSDKVSNTSDI